MNAFVWRSQDEHLLSRERTAMTTSIVCVCSPELSAMMEVSLIGIALVEIRLVEIYVF